MNRNLNLEPPLLMGRTASLIPYATVSEIAAFGEPPLLFLSCGGGEEMDVRGGLVG